MTPITLAEKIGLPEEVRDAALGLRISESDERRFRAALDRDQAEFEGLIRETPDPELWVLSLYLKWGAEAYGLYHAAGVPDRVYFDTFRDITIWSGKYAARTGRVGLIEWHWHPKHIRMQLFRLGRLQFEPIGLRGDARLGDTVIPAGTPALSVHIPTGDTLSHEAVEESLKEAEKFFPKYFGMSYNLYYCCSWLLATELGGMISPDSHIADFRRRFSVYDNDYSFAQAEDYVFTKRMDDPSLYPEDTSLQRNLKHFLISGGKMGMGKGVFIR